MEKVALGIMCFLFLILGFVKTSFSEDINFPLKINIIDKNQADYLTPENTLFSIRSCMLAEDIDWCDETMADEYLQDQIQKFSAANIDRNQLFELEKQIRESFIIDKFYFKDAVILLVENYDYDGSSTQLPLPFVKENGFWKITNNYAADKELLEYFYHTPPLFYGKGQKPDDVNSFLGYEQPTQAKTVLSVDTANYKIYIYYGKTVIPATFEAKLNKQDISTHFTPKPLTDQEVQIPLQQGRNVLILSIEGARKDGKKARDTDRLVFIVP